MRRLAITIGLGLVAVLALAVAWAPSGAAAQTPAPPVDAASLAPVDVLQVTGFIDRLQVDSIRRAIARSESNGAQALILQLDTRATTVSDAEVESLLTDVRHAKVPIGVWVGPARGSRAYGPAAQLLAVADVTAMVRGSRIGYLGEPLTVDGGPVSLGSDPATGIPDELRTGSMDFDTARAAGLLKLTTTDEGVPAMTSMVLAMDDLTIDGVELNTVVPEIDDDGNEQLVSTAPVFADLGLFDRLMHAVANPSTAYLLLIVGLALLVFEFFTAGVGIGGGVGAICTILGCYGMASLHARPFAVACIVLAMLAFSVDVQVGIPRVWTGIGLALFVIGSLFLYTPQLGHSMRLGWLSLLVGIGGVALTFISGMPSMVRTRFATPTIGREWMIGMMGSATTSISPEGIVLVDGGRWRARTNRATPINAGDPIRVAAIDGVTLDVEPEHGAARDYRERRNSDADA